MVSGIQGQRQAETGIAGRIRRLWTEHSQPCTSHPYLTANGIDDPGGVRRIGDSIAIPLRTIGEPLVNLVFFGSDGTVECCQGAEVDGTYCAFGSGSSVGRDNTVYICEGWANGWTIHRATGSLVLAVVFQDQLTRVARDVRRRLPTVRIILCRDIKPWTNSLQLPPAFVAAYKAALKIQGAMCLHLKESFNDLRRRKGLEPVRQRLVPGQSDYPTREGELEGYDVLKAVCFASVHDPDQGGKPASVISLLHRVIHEEGGTPVLYARQFSPAARLLGNIGLRVVGDDMLVANSRHCRPRWLAERWPNGRWKSLLGELPETRPIRATYFGPGRPTSRATAVPLSLILPWIGK